MFMNYYIVQFICDREVSMKSITIHGLDEGLDKSIRDKARERGLSINKTLKELLGKALGINNSQTHDRRDEFLDLYGVWSAEDSAELKKNLETCEQIDPGDWQ